MKSYLRPKDGAVAPGYEAIEVVFAKDQPEYLPLRTLNSWDLQRRVVSRWSPTEDQRKAIAEGGDIFLELMTFGQPLQPLLLYVASDEDADEIAESLGHKKEL